MAEEIAEVEKTRFDMDDDLLTNDDDKERDSCSKKTNILISSSPLVMLPPRNSDNIYSAAALPSPEVSSASASSLMKFLSSTHDDENSQSEKVHSNTVNIGFDNVLIDTSQHSTQMTKSGRKQRTMSTHREVTTTQRYSGVSQNSAPLSQISNETSIQNALIDDIDSETSFSVELQTFSNQDVNNVYSSISKDNHDMTRPSDYPGTAGYLEMEEEPPRELYIDDDSTTNRSNNHNTVVFGSESIKTNSGLILTHRKTANALPLRNKQQHHPLHENVFRDTQQNHFEVDNDAFQGWNKENPNFRHRKEGGDYFTGSSHGIIGNGNTKHSMVMVQVKRLMSYVKIWVVLFLFVLLAMTGVFFHSMEQHNDSKVSLSKTDTIQSPSINVNGNANENLSSPDSAPDKILLLPLTDSSQLSSPFLQHQQQLQGYQQLQHNHVRRLQSSQEAVQLSSVRTLKKSHDVKNDSDSSAFSPQLLHDLRHEFEDWIQHHGKAYHSEEEKEHHFSAWSWNHRRTIEKNARHGPCSLTKQHVFGSNEFKDLTPEEFNMKFLKGYKSEFIDVLEEKQREWSPDIRQLRKDSGIGMVLDPKIHKMKIHESVVEKQRHLQKSGSRYKPQVMGSSHMYCKWYDLACVLRYVWQSTGIQFGSLIGTMEPKYDADAFPNSVDWRDSGAITDVRTQGECGACWAVTAVETIESAYFIATGTLYELSESEIIVCDDSCEMCSGGWPQNAFEWVMDHGGLPLQSSLPYNAYTLIALTAGLEGESEYYDETTVESYRAEVCPVDDNDGSSSKSNDNSYWEDGTENENYADFSNQGRYGNIKGYGYATDRCLCYTDGSGCDCEDQDEDTAVRNIATYGPAVVCLEASTWQDYTGGIMTSSIGCGHEFLDMNHCVQVVGYAFTTSADCNGEEDCSDRENDESGSNSNSNSGSNDSNSREGYWIVRNQWGGNWGMNGYAYVSMGENTCGILNDMTIAYA